EHSPPE
ncbi:hypothetical protein CP8484711_0586, partial [Chlamydia psittaci 84-8471/1]